MRDMRYTTIVVAVMLTVATTAACQQKFGKGFDELSEALAFVEGT